MTFNGFMAFAIHFGIYWTFVLFFDDVYNIKAVKDSLKNQFVLTLPLSILFFNYYPIEYNNIFLSLACLPFIIIMSDIYFYCTHRPFHTTLLWKYHKTHHHNTVSIAKSLDADIIEHTIGNLGSFIIGFVIFQYWDIIFNIYIFHIWVAISTISTCVSHSNKRILGDKGVHEIHHKYLKYNFGTGFYIMDRIMGSYIKEKQKS